MEDLKLTNEELEILHCALLSRISTFADVKKTAPTLRVVQALDEEIDFMVKLNSKLTKAMEK